jgi:AcrR family transcriptional regulator
MASAGKKQHIIDVAVTVLSRRGKKATISEIAAAAGVNDSVIYHYFKNKTDLLFYAAAQSVKIRLADLERYLAGIREPVSRLSKLIWYQLNYHDDEPEYAKFTIFDSRAHRDFFRHEGSEYFLHWMRKLDNILKDGIREGSFSADISVSVVNAMIFGLLDMENILVFTGKRSGSAKDDFNAILDLVLSVLQHNEKETASRADKKKMIMSASEKIFSENGFDESTTIDIAQAAGVAEGTLYEYFNSKEEILFSSMGNHFIDHAKSTQKTLTASDPIEKLSRFIKETYFLYLREPFFARNFIAGGIYNENFYHSPAYEDFAAYMDTMDIILDEGKSKGLFRPDINNRIFKNLFIGCFSHIMLRWLNSTPHTYFDTINAINWTATLLLRAAVLKK